MIMIVMMNIIMMVDDNDNNNSYSDDDDWSDNGDISCWFHDDHAKLRWWNCTYVVRHHVTRIKSEIINAQKAKKRVESWIGPYSFLAFYHIFFCIFPSMKQGKLYIDLKLRIWRIQICQKDKYFFSDFIWLSWWRTTYIHVGRWYFATYMYMTI